MDIFLIFAISISLSMDAFSLALAYGTLDLTRQEIFKLSIVVGIFHFFMPLLGQIIGCSIASLKIINPNFLVCLILTIIGLQMVLESFKTEIHKNKMKLSEIIIFALAVSLDSFSVGIGLKTITDYCLITVFCFSLISFLFTTVGLFLGKKINHLIGKVSKLIGGLVLIFIGFMYLF